MALEDLARFATESTSPLERIENRLGLWVSMLVVPIFAFANAGVFIDTSAVNASVFGGVLLGLVVGKPVGIFLFSLAAVKLGIGRLPAGRVVEAPRRARGRRGHRLHGRPVRHRAVVRRSGPHLVGQARRAGRLDRSPEPSASSPFARRGPRLATRCTPVDRGEASLVA